MANDIYFGSNRKQPSAEHPQREMAPRASSRPNVTRDPANDAGASYSRREPGQDGMMEQMRSLGASGSREARPRVTRDPQPGKAYLERRAGVPQQDRSPSAAPSVSRGGRSEVRGNVRYDDRPFRAPERHPAEEQMITEQIDSELLHRAPTQIPFNYIDTGDEATQGKRVSEKKRQRIKNKKIRAAQKSAKKAAKRKKKSGFRRFVKALVCVLLVLALLAGGGTAYVVTGYRPQKLASNAYVDSSALLSNPAVYNLLVMGIDMQDTGATSRSDSMILLSVDNVHSKLKMTSFMRDSYVTIPDHGDAKLNAACTYGGPQLVCDTIEYNFGVHIDGYVKVGYEILMDLVDGLGGITIPEVDSVEAAALADEGYDAPIGTNIKMNGLQALQYCRIRKGQTDFYRTERQREVLGIIIKKAMLTNPVTLALLGRKLIAKTECSVSQAELFALAFRALPCLIGGTADARIPLDGTWYDDTRDYQAVLVVNFEENTAFLRDFIYGK
ncbi:MAG: LCP family protein [Clostridia bacterium]|nr:LCP family protein [Clostridia bacterium]